MALFETDKGYKKAYEFIRAHKFVYEDEVMHEISKIKDCDYDNVKANLKEHDKINFHDGIFEYKEEKIDPKMFLKLVNVLDKYQYFEIDHDHIDNSGEKYSHVISNGFPKDNRKDFLSLLLFTNQNTDITIDLNPISKVKLYNYLKRQEHEIEERIYQYVNQGLDERDLKEEAAEVKEHIKELGDESIKLFNLSISMSIKSSEPKETPYLVDKVKNLIKPTNIKTNSATKCQDMAFKSNTPINTNHIDKRKIMIPSKFLGTNFPFIKE